MRATQESAFLASMAEWPDDDVRLIFADWLEENGDPDRAELIRIQCGSNRDDPAAKERANELLKTHRDRWEAPFRVIEAEIKFQRGFPYFLKTDIQSLAENAALLGLAPEWHLQLTRSSDYYDENDEEAPRIEPYAQLGGAPFAGRIRTMNFSWGWVHPTEVAAALTPAVAAAVRELRFGDDPDKRGILEQILRVPNLSLHALAFLGDTSGGIKDAGCRLIAEAPNLARLRRLELPNNSIGPEGVAALAGSPHVRALVELDLEGGSNRPNEIGPEGARHLAGSDGLRHLESLNLVYNHIRDAGLAALAESTRLSALRTLYLPGNDVTDDGLRALARSAGLPALDWLSVEGLGRGAITAGGVRELAASPRMARLTGLILTNNPIGDDGAAALADAPGASGLRELHVASCGISRDGFVRMLESPHLAGVQAFSLSGLSREAVQELKARFGGRVR